MSEEDLSNAISRRQEKRLLKRAAEIARSSYPNPSREGCPGREQLENVAYRRVALTALDPAVIEHIASCSPCFSEYTQLRKRRQTVKLLTIVVAGLCLGAGIVASAWFARRSEPVITRKQPPVQETKPDTMARLTPTVNATVDLRFSSPSRSETPQGQQQPLPRVPRAVAELTILLPLGSDEGEYEVEFLAADGRRSQTQRGSATFRDQAEVLTVVVDTRDLTPGEYELRLRPPDGVWRSFRTQLE